MSRTLTTYVLVGTSPADAARRAELRALAADLGAEVAFLQMTSPALSATLDRLVDQGVRRIVLVGVSAGVGGPGVSWLRRIAADWWRSQGSEAPEVCTAASYMTDSDEWRNLVALARPITHGGPGLTSDAWEDVPQHRQQVFVCRGPRCTVAGAEESWTALVVAMMAHGVGDDDVLLTQTGCQFPCNHAPVMTVQPDDVWYGSVDSETAGEIVTSHLLNETPVARAQLRRQKPQV